MNDEEQPLKTFRVAGRLIIDFEAEVEAEDSDCAREHFEDDPQRAVMFANSEDIEFEVIEEVDQ